jgi:hypothetical protein
MPWSEFCALALVTFVVFTFFCASIAFICVASLKLKHVNLVLTAVLMLVTRPTFITLYPKIELNSITQWIPVLNLGLMLRSCLTNSLHPLQCLCSLAEMVCLTALGMALGIKLMSREYFLLKDLP